MEQFDKAKDELYPDRAQPPLPKALPLKEYTGTYFHPAYRNLTIDLSDASKQLRAVQDSVWQMIFDFVHVSGEFWIIYVDMKNAPNLLSGQVARAEFRIGATGKVDKLMVEFMEEGSEGIITFDKIA